MSASITKQVTFSIDHSSRCKCQEYKHQRVGHEFLPSVRISTKLTTNFEASGSTQLVRSRHNVRDQWLLMQGTNKDASRCTGSVASDAGNQSPEQACRKKSCEKLLRRDGTSSAKWLSSGSSKVWTPRFARFHEDSNLGDRVSISSENHDERTVPKVHVLHLSLLSQRHPTVLQSDTSVSLFHTQRDSV